MQLQDVQCCDGECRVQFSDLSLPGISSSARIAELSELCMHALTSHVWQNSARRLRRRWPALTWWQARRRPSGLAVRNTRIGTVRVQEMPQSIHIGRGTRPGPDENSQVCRYGVCVLQTDCKSGDRDSRD